MKIAALISGGVDSALALHLLRREVSSSNITAYYLKIWLEDELAFLGNCPWEEDLTFAQEVCRQADVKLEVVPMQAEYWERVVSYTLRELKEGRTPSPDIFCNQRIKFGAFLEAVATDTVMTGHYARVIEKENRNQLWRGIDPVKDQSYFLSHLHPSQLDRCLFPIGHLPKSEVRREAQTIGLANSERPDSQGICFLGKISFRDFVKFHLGTQKGPIIDKKNGKVLGYHEGYWFHTIGQRKGLQLSGGPWFVCEKNVKDNIIYVQHGEEPAKRSSFMIAEPHWIGEAPSHEELLHCKLRHGPKLFECRISEGRQVTLTEGDQGIASGQFCVVYRGEHCLGGAMIM